MATDILYTEGSISTQLECKSKRWIDTVIDHYLSRESSKTCTYSINALVYPEYMIEHLIDSRDTLSTTTLEDAIDNKLKPYAKTMIDIRLPSSVDYITHRLITRYVNKNKVSRECMRTILYLIWYSELVSIDKSNYCSIL